MEPAGESRLAGAGPFLGHVPSSSGCTAAGEHATAAELVEVGEADARELVEEVGLGGTDAVSDLWPGAEGAAFGHAVIVRRGNTSADAL